MEQTLKKKTKQLISLRTNNYIESEVEKQVFFQQVLEDLQQKLQSQQFTFLTTYLLSQQGSNTKRQKYQFKTNTQMRVMTQPDQHVFNPSQIDTTLFQQNTVGKNRFSRKNTSIRTKQIDFGCTNTPKKQRKNIVCQNKKFLDLDRKLEKKYIATQDKIVYKPNFLLLQGKQNKRGEKFLIKTSYQKSFVKKMFSIDKIKRLTTDFSYSKNQNTEPSDFKSQQKFKTWRNSQSCQTQRSRKSQNFVPKTLINEVLLSRRLNKISQGNSIFSDFKLSTRYKDQF